MRTNKVNEGHVVKVQVVDDGTGAVDAVCDRINSMPGVNSCTLTSQDDMDMLVIDCSLSQCGNDLSNYLGSLGYNNPDQVVFGEANQLTNEGNNSMKVNEARATFTLEVDDDSEDGGKSVEEFIVAARKANGIMKVKNLGPQPPAPFDALVEITYDPVKTKQVMAWLTANYAAGDEDEASYHMFGEAMTSSEETKLKKVLSANGYSCSISGGKCTATVAGSDTKVNVEKRGSDFYVNGRKVGGDVDDAAMAVLDEALDGKAQGDVNPEHRRADMPVTTGMDNNVTGVSGKMDGKPAGGDQSGEGVEEPDGSDGVPSDGGFSNDRNYKSQLESLQAENESLRRRLEDSLAVVEAMSEGYQSKVDESRRGGLSMASSLVN